jgi:thioredoxin 1
MKVFTDANFNLEVLQSNIPVVVDFWSTQCGQPCDDTENMLQGLVSLYPGVSFGTLQGNTNPVTVAAYTITIYPTVLIFDQGMVVNRFDGPPTQTQMINALNALLGVGQTVAAGDENQKG